MKYLVTIAVVLVLSQTQLYSQTLGCGVKAGLNFSEFNNNLTTNYTGTASTIGFVGGVWGRAGIFGVFVQPELLYSQRKGAFTSKVDGTAVINTLSYFDIPVLVGYKLLFARAYVGPNFQFLIDANQQATDAAKDPYFAKDNYNSSAVGFQAGVGVDLLKLSVDLRYDGNLGNLGKEITVNGVTYDYGTRASMWQLTLGFKIF